MRDCQAELRQKKETSAATPWAAAIRRRWPSEFAGPELEAGLPGLLTALGAHLERSVQRSDALELLLVGLEHLFQQLAALYERHLPALAEATRPLREGLLSPDYLPARHAIWLSLGEVSRTLFQGDLSCRLLAGASDALLDMLDSRHAAEYSALTYHSHHLPTSASVPPLGCCPLWLRQQLTSWQESYQRLPPFALQFGRPGSLSAATAAESTTCLDRAFALLLEEAGAIFGDLLPGLAQQATSTIQEQSIFLIDMAQHGEQIERALDSLWEPLNTLSEAFGLDTLL